jgi:filamentous hemagglutinin
LLSELSSQGIKHTPENVVEIAKGSDNRIFFLETGNSQAGLQHIVEGHGADFARRGIAESQIPEAVMAAVTRGKVVGHQGRGAGRPIYEVEFNGQTHRIAITAGDNGFIVGANPAR